NGGPYTTIASPTATSFTNTGLTNGTSYYYVVTAVNISGESAKSAQASVTPQVAAPTIPTSLAATAGDGEATLTWKASSGIVDSYNILRSTTSGGPYNVVGVTSSTTFTNALLTNGTT